MTQLGEQAQAIPRLESKVSANEVLLTRTQEQVRRHQSIMAYCRCSCIGNENLSLTRESFYEFCAEDFIPSLHSAPLSQLLSSVMVFYENRETMYDILQLCMTYYSQPHKAVRNLCIALKFNDLVRRRNNKISSKYALQLEVSRLLSIIMPDDQHQS